MDSFLKRGYVIRETGPVYYTRDMDRTARWFQDTLGWYYEIDERDENGAGQYGCVYDLPREIERLHIAPFTGIHMFYGEPVGEPGSCMVAFMRVQNIDALHAYIRKSGWEQVSDLKEEPWGAKTCTVTTIDGTLLRFFEQT